MSTPADAPPRVTRRRAQTRERLLDAALQVVEQRSLQSMTVEAVCEQAGYTRGAFYSNFSTMDELLVALFEDRARAVLTTLRAGLDGAGHREVADVVADLLRALPGERLWYQISTDVAAQALRSPGPAAVLAAHRADVRRELATALTATLARLGRRPTTTPEALSAAVVALHEGSRAQVFLDTPPTAEADRVRALTQLVLGLTEPDGGRR